MRKKSNKARGIYLIKRGPKSEHHNAPFHPVIICTRYHTAKWEVGDTGDGATLWTNSAMGDHGGFLMMRYKGYEIDYGTVVKEIKLFDSEEKAGFYHHGTEPWTLLNGAVWWSDQELPKWLEEAGVIYPPDNFTKQSIIRDSGLCLLPQSKAEKFESLRDELFHENEPSWLIQDKTQREIY